MSDQPPNRPELMSEASALIDLYREVSRQGLAREVEPAGDAIERALKNLDQGWTQETLDRAARELDDARQTLARIQSIIGNSPHAAPPGQSGKCHNPG
jgi:hypothetical protein